MEDEIPSLCSARGNREGNSKKRLEIRVLEERETERKSGFLGLAL